MRHLITLVIPLGFACTPSSQPAPSAQAPATVDIAKTIGDPCTSSGDPRGDCGGGMFCAPTPGGMCMAFCGQDSCPASTTCVGTIRAGEICARSCQSNDDCREAEGYLCDETWKVCTLPGLLSPPAPQCPAVATLSRGQFTEPVALSSPNGFGDYHFEPAAALDSAGGAAIAYIANPIHSVSKMQTNRLGLAHITRDGDTTIDRHLDTGKDNHFDPWMARDRHGLLYLVWMAFDGPGAPERNMDIAIATSKDGMVWSAPQSVLDDADCPEAAPGCVDKPMIAIGPDPDASSTDIIYVFYFSGPGGGLKLVRSTDGGKTFSKSSLAGEAAYGDAEVDSAGTLHMTWVTSNPRAPFGDPQGAVVYVQSRDRGQTFTAPTTVYASSDENLVPFFFSNAQVSSDAKRGFIYVTYPAGTSDGAWDIYLAVSTDNGKTFSNRRLNDDPHCANHMTPMVATDSVTGAVHVAWTENRGGSGRVVSIECEAGASSCGPNIQVSGRDFAEYALVRHSPRWLGEYDSILIDQVGRQLHLIWTQTVSEAQGPRARIFYSSRSLK